MHNGSNPFFTTLMYRSYLAFIMNRMVINNLRNYLAGLLVAGLIKIRRKTEDSAAKDLNSLRDHFATVL